MLHSDEVQEEIAQERERWIQGLQSLGVSQDDAQMISQIVRSEFWPVLYKVLEAIQEGQRNGAFDGERPKSYDEYMDAFAVSKAIDRIADTLSGIAQGYEEYVQAVNELRGG